MEDKTQKEPPGRNMGVDEIIAERERLDKLFKDQFTKTITVMFTGLKGSASRAETQDDFAVRSVIKRHHDILFPLFKKHNGTLVKTMGGGTMSYFADPMDAVRAAAGMQKGADEFNLEQKATAPVLMRIGIHTGEGIVEKNDVFGDIVTIASGIEAQANPGEIYMSEATFNELSDRTGIYCGFVKETLLEGKKDPVRLYKAFWNPGEIGRDLAAKKSVPETEAEKKLPPHVKIIAAIVIALLVAGAFIKLTGIAVSSDEEKRTKEHHITLQDTSK